MDRGCNATAKVELLGLAFDRLTSSDTLDAIFAALARREGGILLTANLDILRRYTRESDARMVYDEASITVADGMPIVWASKIAGDPLPMRVAGSSLVAPLASRAAREGRSIFLLGGEGDDAELAARSLRAAHPSLDIVGVLSPRIGFPMAPAELDPIRERLVAARPDLVLVALGSPKQEALAVALAPSLPSTWFLGIGISLAFVSGRVSRAPALVQSLGLEWLHRVANEPRRLARRYFVDGLPFALELFAHALGARIRTGRSGPRSPRASE